MTKQRFEVKVKFHGTRALYTYQSPHLFAAGDEVTVGATNGETKVVTVVSCHTTTKAKMDNKPYFVKSIQGIVVKCSDIKNQHPIKEDNSPI